MRKALQTEAAFELEATIMCELAALRGLGVLDTLNGITDYLVCPDVHDGQVPPLP